VLSDEQRSKYEQIRQTALADLAVIDREIETELASIKKRLLALQEDKKAVKQVLEGACARLGETKNVSTETAEGVAEPTELDPLAMFRA
jgi:hypothetical protein